MKKAEEVNVALYGLQAVRGEKHTSVDEVQVWVYKWLLNGDKVELKDDQISLHFTLKYFSEEEARGRGEVNKPNLKLKEGDELVMKVSSEYVHRPCELLQMRMILQHIARACAEMNSEMNCSYQNIPPSSGQVSHMQPGGCLYRYEFQDFGDDLTEAVYSIIGPDDLIAV